MKVYSGKFPAGAAAGLLAWRITPSAPSRRQRTALCLWHEHDNLSPAVLCLLLCVGIVNLVQWIIAAFICLTLDDGFSSEHTAPPELLCPTLSPSILQDIVQAGYSFYQVTDSKTESGGDEDFDQEVLSRMDRAIASNSVDPPGNRTRAYEPPRRHTAPAVLCR